MSVTSLPAKVARSGVGATFAALSAARGTRIFHPDGLVYRATYLGGPGAPRATPELGVGAERLALLRFSRGLGLPQPIFDVLGIAIRLCDLHGPGGHQDLLLVSSGDGPVAHYLLRPAGGFFGPSFSSLLPYRVGEETLLFGARIRSLPALGAGRDLDELRASAQRGGLVVELLVASPGGHWRTIGELEVGAPVGGREAESLRFNPWHTGGTIRPAGALNALRRQAYACSQRGWGAPPDRQLQG